MKRRRKEISNSNIDSDAVDAVDVVNPLLPAKKVVMRGWLINSTDFEGLRGVRHK